MRLPLAIVRCGPQLGLRLRRICRHAYTSCYFQIWCIQIECFQLRLSASRLRLSLAAVSTRDVQVPTRQSFVRSRAAHVFAPVSLFLRPPPRSHVLIDGAQADDHWGMAWKKLPSRRESSPGAFLLGESRHDETRHGDCRSGPSSCGASFLA